MKKQAKLVIPPPPLREEAKAAIPGLNYYMGDTGDWPSHRRLQSCGYYFNEKSELKNVVTRISSSISSPRSRGRIQVRWTKRI